GLVFVCIFFFQAEDGIRDWSVTGVQTCALPISKTARPISAVRMLASVIWNRQRPLYMSARCVRPVYFSRRSGDTDGNVWKWSGRSEERRVGKEGRCRGWRGG